MQCLVVGMFTYNRKPMYQISKPLTMFTMGYAVVQARRYAHNQGNQLADI